MKRYVPRNWKPDNWNEAFVKIVEVLKGSVRGEEVVRIEPNLKGRLYLIWGLLTRKKIRLNKPFFNIYDERR